MGVGVGHRGANQVFRTAIVVLVFDRTARLGHKVNPYGIGSVDVVANLAGVANVDPVGVAGLQAGEVGVVRRRVGALQHLRQVGQVVEHSLCPYRWESIVGIVVPREGCCRVADIVELEVRHRGARQACGEGLHGFVVGIDAVAFGAHPGVVGGALQQAVDDAEGVLHGGEIGRGLRVVVGADVYGVACGVFAGVVPRNQGGVRTHRVDEGQQRTVAAVVVGDGDVVDGGVAPHQVVAIEAEGHVVLLIGGQRRGVELIFVPVVVHRVYVDQRNEGRGVAEVAHHAGLQPRIDKAVVADDQSVFDEALEVDGNLVAGQRHQRGGHDVVAVGGAKQEGQRVGIGHLVVYSGHIAKHRYAVPAMGYVVGLLAVEVVEVGDGYRLAGGAETDMGGIRRVALAAQCTDADDVVARLCQVEERVVWGVDRNGGTAVERHEPAAFAPHRGPRHQGRRAVGCGAQVLWPDAAGTGGPDGGYRLAIVQVGTENARNDNRSVAVGDAEIGFVVQLAALPFKAHRVATANIDFHLAIAARGEGGCSAKRCSLPHLDGSAVPAVAIHVAAGYRYGALCRSVGTLGASVFGLSYEERQQHSEKKEFGFHSFESFWEFSNDIFFDFYISF